MKYTLSQLIKHLQSLPEELYYSIPADIFAHSSYIKDRVKARKELALFNIHWQKKGMETTFTLSDPKEGLFWDTDTYRWITKQISVISAHNERISEFAKSMTTQLD